MPQNDYEIERASRVDDQAAVPAPDLEPPALDAQARDFALLQQLLEAREVIDLPSEFALVGVAATTARLALPPRLRNGTVHAAHKCAGLFDDVEGGAEHRCVVHEVALRWHRPVSLVCSGYNSLMGASSCDSAQPKHR